MFGWHPTQPPPFNDIQGLTRWVMDEFNRLSVRGNQVESVVFQELHVEPMKPRVGTVVFADGTDWDPGAGRGFYGYDGSGWNQL